MQTQFDRSPISRSSVTAKDITTILTLAWLGDFDGRSAVKAEKVHPKRTTVKVSLRAGRQASVTVIPRGSSGAPIGSVVVSALGASVRGGSVITANDNRGGSFTFRVTWRPRVRNLLFFLSGDGWRIEKELKTIAGSD